MLTLLLNTLSNHLADLHRTHWQTTITTDWPLLQPCPWHRQTACACGKHMPPSIRKGNNRAFKSKHFNLLTRWVEGRYKDGSQILKVQTKSCNGGNITVLKPQEREALVGSKPCAHSEQPHQWTSSLTLLPSVPVLLESRCVTDVFSMVARYPYQPYFL